MFASRASLMSLATVAALLFLLSVPMKRARAKKLNFLLGLLIGLLPTVQHQAFIAGLILVVGNRCLNWEQLGKHEILGFAIPFGVLLATQIIHFWPSETNLPLCQRSNLWDDLTERGIFFAPICLWWGALGIFGVVTLCVCWFFVDKHILKIYLPAMVVFLLGNFFNFQCMPRDNILLFYPGWMLAASVVFIATLVRFAQWPETEQGKGIATAWATVFFVCAVVSALIGLSRLRGERLEIWGTEFEKIGNWIQDNLPIKAIVVIPTDGELSPVSTIAGRRVISLSDIHLIAVGLTPEEGEKTDTHTLLEREHPYLLPNVRYVLIDSTRYVLARSWTELYRTGPYRLLTRPEQNYNTPI
jgi:hypothetical protein